VEYLKLIYLNGIRAAVFKQDGEDFKRVSPWNLYTLLALSSALLLFVNVIKQVSGMELAMSMAMHIGFFMLLLTMTNMRLMSGVACADMFFYTLTILLMMAVEWKGPVKMVVELWHMAAVVYFIFMYQAKERSAQ
jgi:hypothetical protein